MVLAGENLIAGLHNELETPAVELISGMVGCGCRLLQGGIRRNHLARHQILADAEVFQGTLRLSAPEFVDRNIHFSEAIRLLPNVADFRIHDRLAAGSRLI